jgi:hypothetical protein
VTADMDSILDLRGWLDKFQINKTLKKETITGEQFSNNRNKKNNKIIWVQKSALLATMKKFSYVEGYKLSVGYQCNCQDTDMTEHD